MRTRLKVCCISSPDEASLAITMGADALGLVGHMPSGPGTIDDALIARIARGIAPPTASFLLTSETEPARVVDHVQRTGVNTVQLVDDTIDTKVWSALRASSTSLRIIQVIHVRDASSVALATRASEHVDAILLDSGNPDAAIRELGGTGRVHDWEISRRIVRESAAPVFLAGGLDAGNVARAIREVRPHGVDVCSGVRRSGALDPARLEAFARALREADATGA